MSYIRSRCSLTPEVVLVLGSGLGPIADEVQDATIIPYAEVPHFHTPAVQGHPGRLVIGTFAGVPALVLQVCASACVHGGGSMHHTPGPTAAGMPVFQRLCLCGQLAQSYTQSQTDRHPQCLSGHSKAETHTCDASTHTFSRHLWRHLCLPPPLHTQGRFHYYEGHPMEEVILPIRVAKFLGCHTAVLTNAAGGINHDFHLGDLMLITGERGGGARGARGVPG